MKKVIITVSDKFEDELFKKLCDGIKTKLGDCEIEQITDNKIIDGFTVEIDGTVYDYSILSKVNQFEQELKK